MLKTLFVIGLCIYGAVVTIYALRSDQPTRYKGKHRRLKNDKGRGDKEISTIKKNSVYS